MKKRVDLSLRLSQVDPQAAKKLRMKKERKKKKQTAKLSSDGESVEPEERLIKCLEAAAMVDSPTVSLSVCLSLSLSLSHKFFGRKFSFFFWQ